MALSDMDAKCYVRRASAEFDRLRRLEFLAERGFDASRRDSLRYRRRICSSKAVVCVAHKYVATQQVPLHPSGLIGDDATVGGRLRSLDFDVIKTRMVPEHTHSGSFATLRRIHLTDLAIICANCHGMSHRGGACRPLEAPDAQRER